MMKFRRDLIIVALTTFCLTSTLFMVATTRSADSPNWDPWADIKEDGTVDIYDAITLANAYGSSGETPKNVNVTNWPSLCATRETNVSFHWTLKMGYILSWTDPSLIDCRGFSRMYVYAHATNVTWYPINTTLPVALSLIYWTTDENATDFWSEGDYRPEYVSNHLNFTVSVTQIVGDQNVTYLSSWPDYSAIDPTTATIDVKAPWCSLSFGVPYYPFYTFDGDMDLAVTVYLRND